MPHRPPLGVAQHRVRRLRVEGGVVTTTYCADCGVRTWRPEPRCRECDLYAPVRAWVRTGLIWRAAS